MLIIDYEDKLRISTDQLIFISVCACEEFTSPVQLTAFPIWRNKGTFV